MKTAVEQVANWYDENLGRLSATFAQVSIRLFKPGDEVEGKVVIEVESQTVAGMVTLWNKGDIEVLRLDLPAAGRESVAIDDRVRAQSEHIPSLLERYFQLLEQPRTT